MDKHMNPQDPENMLGYIDALADDLVKAWALGSELPLPDFAGMRTYDRDRASSGRSEG